MLDFRAYDSNGVQEILKSIYADSKFDFLEHGRARFRIDECGPVSIFNVTASSPFNFSCEESSKSLAIHSCIEGGIDYRRNDTTIEIEHGDIVPISSTTNSGMVCNSSIVHQTISIDEGMLNRQFYQITNGEIDFPVVFDFKKLSDSSRRNIYNVIRTIHLLSQNMNEWSVDIDGYEEFLSYFLLNELSSDYNFKNINKISSSHYQYKEAERYILDNALYRISLQDLVQVANCSIGTLNKKFLFTLGVGVNAAIICAKRAANDSSLSIKPKSLEDVVRAYNKQSYLTPFEHIVNFNTSGDLSPVKSRALEPHLLEAVIHRINTNLSGRISISELAMFLGMSRQTFTKSFQIATGITPAAYILQERVNWAQWMISNSQENLASIAIETGFSSQAHMTTSIKKIRSITPSVLRKKTYLI